MRTLRHDAEQGETIKVDAPAEIEIVCRKGRKTRVKITTDGNVTYLPTAQKGLKTGDT